MANKEDEFGSSLNADTEILTAVTDWIEYFVPKYDPVNSAISTKYHANITAKKQSTQDTRTVKDILHFNAIKSERARSLGTATSCFIELWHMDKTITAKTGYEQAFIKFMSERLWKVVGVEVPVISKPLGLKGKIDMVCRDENNNNILLEFKTSETLSKSNDNLKDLFYMLKNTGLTKASIQILVYDILYSNKNNIKHIVHLKPTGKYEVLAPLDIKDIVLKALKARYEG